MTSTTYAVLSTTTQELETIEAQSWGDALARYLEEEGVEWESLLGCVDTTPSPHYTVDLYSTSGEEETVLVMELDDLQVERPKYFPNE
ncbi:hypothetical protein [Salinibacter phage M8CR30-4]|uniref:Uncharacterized protein n=2 Tax=Holosalinivirus M8CR302 TaxID=2041855 RepID=A0A2I6UGI2_9CAUD|nr:hypothetical protein FGG64_gp25 [Salinibacter phage M8CR30-2]AUO79061.1 hypothetical protein [Salinibacter phage M8CR30-2]AUO79102.1 hypothetical protein [Salinibacter phage M8CR30-4]